MAVQFTGVYTKKDRAGRFFAPGYFPCCHQGAADACGYCRNCLIRCGPRHLETVLASYPLPVMTDRFDPQRGRWLRGIYWVPQPCCLSCIEDLELDRYQATLRIAPVDAPLRHRRVLRWAEERGLPLPRRRHLGGFVRAAPTGGGPA